MSCVKQASIRSSSAKDGIVAASNVSHEHAPVRESCLNCHTPHGSNQHALLVAPVPMLCQQCHSHTMHPNDLLTEQSLATGMGPDERLMGRGCISCHAQVHGSNNPAGPRLHK